jgi:hypothetical protein
MGIFTSLLGMGSKIMGSIDLLIPKLLTEGIKIVGNWVKENILNLEDAPSYKPETATLEETKKINELISKCVREYNNQAKEYDELAQKVLDEQFSSIIENLNEINKITPIIEEYIFQQFLNNLESIKNTLENFFSKQISNAFSPYNNKLIDILELDAGYNKKEKLNQLALDTLANANREFSTKLLSATQKQQKFIETVLNNYIENRNAELENSKKLTEKILTENDKEEKEKMKLDFIDLIEKMNLLGEILYE